jgi:hypothetical protein
MYIHGNENDWKMTQEHFITILISGFIYIHGNGNDWKKTQVQTTNMVARPSHDRNR